MCQRFFVTLYHFQTRREKGIFTTSYLDFARWLDDLLEDLRLAGIFDLRQVAFAQMETNGKLSVLQTDGGCGPFYTVVSDGILDAQSLARAGRGREWLDRVLRAGGAKGPEDVFLFCVDRHGNMILLKKEGR